MAAGARRASAPRAPPCRSMTRVAAGPGFTGLPSRAGFTLRVLVRT